MPRPAGILAALVRVGALDHLHEAAASDMVSPPSLATRLRLRSDAARLVVVERLNTFWMSARAVLVATSSCRPSCRGSARSRMQPSLSLSMSPIIW